MLPAPFIEQMRSLLGEDEAQRLFRGITEAEAPVSIRLNPQKNAGAIAKHALAPVPWASRGMYLAERPRFVLDPAWHAGGYYVQEAASMFIEQVYRLIAKDFPLRRVLDLCAAPGGKSTLWRSLLPEGALLVSNEVVRQRAQILTENMAKWGHPDGVVTSSEAAEFGERLQGFFDVVAADVPCSGEGMFRKDETARSEWSPAAVRNCAERQWQIIRDVWGALRSGGYLVYSTCTYNREENEETVLRICRELGAEFVPFPDEIYERWHIRRDIGSEVLPVARFMPHLTQSEGLFIALLRKTGETSVASSQRKKRRAKTGAAREAAEVKPLHAWLTGGADYQILTPDETHAFAVKTTLLEDVQQVVQATHALSFGIPLAERKGRKYIPSQALALSTQRNADTFPQVEVSHEEALSYLRREALTLPADVQRGYILLSHEGNSLGFVNNLGTRANNLYPPQWRIRT